jgi:crotonobetainyl-CoA:carnitine CoA-transferase CaiB-like acyl-CoA transferase
MLSPYRALDISDFRGTVCGQILAWLGATVIKIEKPGGSTDRVIEPFCRDFKNRKLSLFWLSFNRGKKSITLDIMDNEGKEIFKKLVKESDIIIESYEPGYLDRIGLGYKILCEINPRIILVLGRKAPTKIIRGLI